MKKLLFFSLKYGINTFLLILLGDNINTSENSKVPLTVKNIKKYMCPKCPVQASSKCPMDKLDSLVKVLENAGEGNVPEAQGVSGLYCSTGKATCHDLNLKNNAYVIHELSGRNIACKM